MKALKLMNWKTILILFSSLFLFSACDDDMEGTSSVSFEITDAPTDDASVESVFVTVTDIKVDGQSIGMSEKQTIDLKAYANGQTKLLGTKELEAGSYSEITLVLDNATDANGNAPGCYVQTVEDEKFNLMSSTSGTTEITLDQAWEIKNQTTSRIVMDFDLRKALRRSEDAEVRYQFVSNSTLQSAIRVFNTDNTGKIEGSYDETFGSNVDKIIVYAYNNGEFSASEAEEQGTDNIRFLHAVTSTEVEGGISSDSYEFSFMDEGEYELVFVGYEENETTEQMEYSLLFESETSFEGDVVEVVEVEAGTTLVISAVITGLL